MLLLAASNNHKYFENHHLSYNYIDHLHILINSLNITNPDLKKRLILINFPKDIEFKNTKVEHLTITGTDNYIKNTSAHIRTEMFIDEMNTEPYLIWVDADTIIRNSLNGLISMLDSQTGKLAVLHRMDRRDEEKFQVAVVGINTKDISKETIKLWNKYAKEDDWFADQLGLYKAAIQTGIDRIDIGSKYNDQYFNKDSIIWHCKGSYNHPNWKAECNKYRPIL